MIAIIWPNLREHAKNAIQIDCMHVFWSKYLSTLAITIKIKQNENKYFQTVMATDKSQHYALPWTGKRDCWLLACLTSQQHARGDRGVTVSMSAFLACHQCYCACSSLVWGWNLRAVVCGIFWSSSPGVFSGYSGFLPSFIGLMVQPIK